MSDQPLNPVHKARLRKIGMDRMSSDAWDVVTSLLAELDQADAYADRLVKWLAMRYPAVQAWEALPTLQGKLTQIDNMVAVLNHGFGGNT